MYYINPLKMLVKCNFGIHFQQKKNRVAAHGPQVYFDAHRAKPTNPANPVWEKSRISGPLVQDLHVTLFYLSKIRTIEVLFFILT